MKKHLLALTIGLLWGGTVPHIATAQVANPAENPERYVWNNKSSCDSTFWDKEVVKEYQAPPDSLITSNPGTWLQGIVAKGWFVIRLLDYPFPSMISKDSTYKIIDIKDSMNELKVALMQLETRFGEYEIAHLSYVREQSCEVVDIGRYGFLPDIDTDLPYFMLKFKNYVSIDSVTTYLWNLPNVARQWYPGDENIDVRLMYVDGRLRIYRGPDEKLYFPYRKLAGYIFMGAYPLSTPENIRLQTHVLQCYPNPAFTQMEIRLFKEEAGVIEIVNTEGAVMQRYSVSGATTLQADVSALPTGTYFVRFGNYTNKIIVRK